MELLLPPLSDLYMEVPGVHFSKGYLEIQRNDPSKGLRLGTRAARRGLGSTPRGQGLPRLPAIGQATQPWGWTPGCRLDLCPLGPENLHTWVRLLVKAGRWPSAGLSHAAPSAACPTSALVTSPSDQGQRHLTSRRARTPF